MVQHKLTRAAHSLPLLYKVFPSVESSGHDREIRVLKEEVDNATLHVVLLPLHFLFDVLLDGLRRVASVDKVLLHRSRITHVLISAHDDTSLSL